MATYPGGVKTFTTKLAGDTIAASHPNDIQDEVTAIENALLNGIAHNVAITGTFSVSGLSTLAGVTGGWTVVTSTATGTQDDFDPGIVGHTIIRLNNASLLTITGLTAGVSGQMVWLLSVNSQVNLSYQTGSTASHQLFNVITSAPTPMLGGAALYIYDGTSSRWRLAYHRQGTPITATFADSNYSGGATDGNWALGSGDVTTMTYWVDGKNVFLKFYLESTTVANTPTELRINSGAWGSFTVTKTVARPCVYNDNAAGLTGGIVIAPTTATYISIQKLTGGTFANATNATGAFGDIDLEVT